MKLLFEPRFDLIVDIITSKAKTTPNIIQLQWGELATVPPRIIRDFFLEAFDKGLTRYTLPHGDIRLREVIREKLLEKNRINASIKNILVTVGSTAAINFVFRVIAGDSGYIIIQDPSWFGYPGIAHYVGAKVFRILESSYSYEALEEAKRKIDNIGGELRGIVMNYPANPTGYVFSEGIMKEVLEFARDYDLLVISDEAYEDYVFYGKHTSIASLGGLDNVVAVYTISKTYSFTGLRIGYAVGKKELIDAMALAQVHTYISPPAINQYVAMRLLQENIAKQVVVENLKLLTQNLKIAKDLAEEYDWDYIDPRGGIYFFFRIPRIDSGEFALKLVEKYGVAVAPGIDFGEKWREWIRITIAKSKEEVEEGLRRIRLLQKEM